MPRKKRSGGTATKRPIERYEHSDKKRINNPPVGLVTPQTDPVAPTHKTYDYITPVPSVKPRQELNYDPHLDPQLVWAGKKEHTSFEVHTVSLHVHERIEPHTIIEAVRKRNGGTPEQPSLFESRGENPPLREAIDFYRYPHGWSNRLIAGDSLLVMNSLLEKEGMAGQVQMFYFDPPYGIKYGSNFQPFVNKREVKDGKDEDLTQEPEMIRAFRDTWELGVHSYLSYLRDRVLLAKELLHESGSCLVQISDENIHHVRELMDEVFGSDNFCAVVSFLKSSATTSEILPSPADHIVWYAKHKTSLKYRQLFLDKRLGAAGAGEYFRVLEPNGGRRTLTEEEMVDPRSLPNDSRVYRLSSLVSQGFRQFTSVPFQFQGRSFDPGQSMNWKTTLEGLTKLTCSNRIEARANSLAYVRYLDDFPVFAVTNIWTDTIIAGRPGEKVYVVQTSPKVIERCLLMTTDPGDLVFDPTCGSGTTAYVAEQWGRRWITCDTSRVAITLAKQRLMAANFDYYELAHPEEGIGSGFRYKTVPHVTLKSIANNPEIREGMTREQIDSAIARYAEQETLYDQPYVDRSRVRVSGPFTMEAVPAPTVRSLDDIEVGVAASGAAGRPSDELSSRGGLQADEGSAFCANNAPARSDEQQIPRFARDDNFDGSIAARDDNFDGSIAASHVQQSLADFRHAPTPLLDASIARSGPTLRHTEWRDELLKTGLRGKGGHHIDFSRVEPLAGTRWLHADAETKGKVPERVVISFGPEHSLLEQRQVELAWEEARTLTPSLPSWFSPRSNSILRRRKILTS